MNYKSELDNIQRIGQTRSERIVCYFGKISGFIGAMSAGFVVGLFFVCIICMLPAKSNDIACLYFMSASMISHLIGFLFCFAFGFNKARLIIIPVMATFGISLSFAFYRCLIWNNCEANFDSIRNGFSNPGNIFVFIFSFVTFAAFVSVEPTFFLIKKYHNSSIQKLNL